MTVRTLRCTDRAYDGLLVIYGTDNAVWAAVYALQFVYDVDGQRCLRKLCAAHAINPDA